MLAPDSAMAPHDLPHVLRPLSLGLVASGVFLAGWALLRTAFRGLGVALNSSRVRGGGAGRMRDTEVNARL